MAWTERQRALLEAMGLGLWAPRPGPDADAGAIERSPIAAPAGAPSAPPATSPATPAPTAVAPLEEPCLACPRRMAPLASCGATEPAWLVVGAAPEPDDVAAGRPFTGAAGELLRRMLAAVDIAVDDAAPGRGARLALAVRCAPPDARVPDAAQVAACASAARGEIGRCRPRGVLVLGRAAAQALLGGEPSGRWRGTVHRLGEVPVVVTHELPYLLRRPEAKAEVWDDLCLAREAFDGG